VDKLVEKMEEKIRWRKILGSTKVVLKKEEIKKLKRSMKNAI
jgi:predicted RNA-binding protein